MKAAHAHGHTSDFGVDTRAFAGPLPGRLAAARAAGFTRVLLGARELVDHAHGLDAALGAVRESGLAISGLHVDVDVCGLAGATSQARVDVVQGLLALAAQAGAPLLRVDAARAPTGDVPVAALARDLRKLAMLAVPLRLKVAVAGPAWGDELPDLPLAWEAAAEADMPNLGIALDVADALAGDVPLDDLDLLDPAKLFLVTLAAAADASGAAAGCVFPDPDAHPGALAAWVRRLHAIGYRGDWTLAATHADYRQLPVEWVAERARRSAVWLGETVLRRAVPLPDAVRWRGR